MASESQPPVPPSVPPLPAARQMDDPRLQQQQQRSDKQLSQMQVLQQRILQQQLQKQQLQQLQMQKQHRSQQKQQLQQQLLQKQQQQQQRQQLQKPQKPGHDEPRHHKPRQKQARQGAPPPIAHAKHIENFSISRGPRNNSLYRGLNAEPEGEAAGAVSHPQSHPQSQPQPLPLPHPSDLSSGRQGLSSVSGTPKTAAASSKPDLPICSSRGRAPFGEFSWAIEPPRKDGDGQVTTPSATPSTAAGTPSSPTGAAPSGSNGGSLRASIFKKSGGLAFGGAATPGSQRDADGTDKDGQMKPWHLEVPPGIPYYVVPPPGRRFGALAKAGSRAFAQSPTQGSSQQGAPAGRSVGGGNPFGNSRNISGNRNMSTGNNSNATGAANNRLQKASAVRYMDFNPWKGRHPEDRLTDTSVRMGHYDRLLTPQSQNAETSSARGWLPLLLKQKHSTAMLGQALALANALSREKNHISPASQFKLPPRVTVTDTRRETWLRDLTNAAIPLRKLSRTIPHGLRGKVLLEQCMLKSVPVDRAMWLARCVGAQELRAFKRKGTANIAALAESELRWLKEWTLTVQQFVEAFLVELNLEKDTGRDRLQYAARFARQLYLERLLDHDQFLNWMLVGLRNAARLPAAASASTPYFDLWLFIVEEYFHGIMQRRKTSGHLAVTVLSRLNFLSHFQSAKISSAQAKKLLKIMVQSHPDAFVSHPVWPRYEKLLTTMLLPAPSSAQDQPPATLDAVSTIRHRNDCLRPETSSEMDQVVNYLFPLDSALRSPKDFSSHFADFLRLDKRDAIPFVIRWCASIHRPGLAKVYIAARLIGELCHDDAKIATNYVLGFLSSDRENDIDRKYTKNGTTNGSSTLSKTRQQKLQALQDTQSEGSKALYQLVGLLMAQGLFLPAHYLAALILRSRPSDADDIVPQGRPHVRLVAELPVQFLDRSTSSLRTNHLRRLGYDTDYEAKDIESILSQVQRVFDAMASTVSTTTNVTPATTTTTPTETADQPTEAPLLASVTKLARIIEDRSRNVKVAVADWLHKNVVSPLRAYKSVGELDNGAPVAAAALGSRGSFGKPSMAPISSTNGEQSNATNPANLSLQRTNAIRCLIEKTDDLRLLSEFILTLANYPQSTSVMALCADTVNLYLPAFLALGSARTLYDKVMGRALAITVGVDSGATTAFQTLLPPGTDIRPLLLALPALAEKMPPPGPGSLILGINRQPLRLIPKVAAVTDSPTAANGTAGASGDVIMKKHFEVGSAMASEIQNRLLEIDQRLSVATYDADCSPLSDGRGPHVPQEDAAADEVRDEMVKIASSGSSIDSATMDTLFGTIAMISQGRWRRIQPDGDGPAQSRSRDDFRLSGSLFARLRRFNTTHFDTIMVKWLKRLRTMRDRPAIAILYPVFVVFGCLDLASLMATTADEQPREPGAMIQSPARNTWRTSYLQDVLTLLSVPIAEGHAVLTCDECQRFRVFQHEAPFMAPAGIAALVRNAVAEITLWRHHQRQKSQGLVAMQPAAGAVARKPIDALSVSRLLRTAAVADARKAGSALAKTTDQTVRSGLWEMMTLALTRQITPGRPPLEMLRGLDIFAADVGQLALGLVVSSGPYASLTERAKEADNLANLILRAVSEFQFSSLSVLHSLPADMATGLKDHAQARFLDMVPTRKQLSEMASTPSTPAIGVDQPQNSNNFDVAGGFLNIVRTIMLNHQQQFQKRLEQQQQQQQQTVSAATGAGTGTSAATSNTLPPPPSPGMLPASGIPPLDSSIVDKLGELWCLLQEPTTAAARKDLPVVDLERISSLQHAILRDWLPALLSLILLHLPNRDALLLSLEGVGGIGGLGGSAMSAIMGGAARSDNNNNKAPSQGTSPATFSSPANTTAASMGMNMMANFSAVSSNSFVVGSGGNSSNSNNHGAATAGGLGIVGLARTSRDQEQESVYAGACIALASLYMEVSSVADNDVAVGDANVERSCYRRLALQSRLFDTALLLADNLSDETRQHCVRALRDAVANRDNLGSVGGAGGGDLQPVMAYILSSPVSASIYYPRLCLERLPQMPLFSRPPPAHPSAPPPREWSQGSNSSNTTGEGGSGSGGGNGPATAGPGPLKRMASGMGYGGGGGFFGGPNGNDSRTKRVRFGLKTWDAVSDPSPAVQDNDTAVNLWLLEATKVVRQRRR